MAGAIEEVGARMNVIDGAKFRADMAASTKVVEDFTVAQLDATKASRAAAKVFVESQAIVADSLDATDASRATAEKSMAALNAEQVRSAELAKASAATTVKAAETAAAASTASSRKIGAVTLGHSAGMKTAISASNKILKWGMLAAVGIGYEGIKQYNAFQASIAQSAIDAGVKKSWLPGLTANAMTLSSKYGVAALDVANANYRIASSFAGLGYSQKHIERLTGSAVKLAVILNDTTPTGIEQVARIFGAIGVTGLKATGHSKSAMTPTQTAQWMNAVVGGGDVRGPGFVAAMGTGILPVAASLNLSANQLGAMYDVASPAMGATAAATRLKTMLGMLAAPSTITGPLYTGTGGTALEVTQAMLSHGIVGKGGAMGVLNHMLNTPITSASAANYYSQFMGPGLGTFTGGAKGKATGFIAFLKSHGFSNSQIGLAEKKGFSAVPGMEQYMILHSFGAGHSGAMMLQEYKAWQNGTLKGKLTNIRNTENPKSYAQAFGIAMHEPARKLAIFTNQLKNITITVGKDVTPAFDAFLSDLEKMGKWFGHNKWALDALGIGAGAVVAGAAAIKVTQMVGAVARGGGAIGKVFTQSPATSFKSLLAGGSNQQVTAANIQLDAAKMQLDAATKGVGGIPGAGKTPVVGAPGTIGAAGSGTTLLGPSTVMEGLMAGGILYRAAQTATKYNKNPLGAAMQSRILATAVKMHSADPQALYKATSGSSGSMPALYKQDYSAVYKQLEKDAAQWQKDAASTQKEAAQLQLKAAQVFGDNVAGMAGVLSPANIHSLGKAGVKAKVARK